MQVRNTGEALYIACEMEKRAIRLYERFGFVPVGRRKNYYRKPDEDALLMTKYWNGGDRSC